MSLPCHLRPHPRDPISVEALMTSSTHCKMIGVPHLHTKRHNLGIQFEQAARTSIRSAPLGAITMIPRLEVFYCPLCAFHSGPSHMSH